MAKKIVPIKYTSRDYQTIKGDLTELAKRFYPDTYKDFNEASFGSLMLDSVAYVGDILSFYLDYQANESFLETASEFNNIIKLGKQLGYKHNGSSTSSGIVTFYIAVPVNSSNIGPDFSYAPTLKKGSTLSSKNGAKFILTSDVRFDNPKNEIRVLRTDANGAPTSYGIKAKGSIISGAITTESVAIGAFEKFKKIPMSKANIVEIISVFDREGHEYYEVDFLTQNTIYKSVTNKDINDATLAAEVLKPYIVPRRFVVDRDLVTTYIQFGASSDISVDNIDSMLAEPANSVLQMHGKNYVSSDYFDPTRLLNSDKFGIAPAETTIYVTYRYQTTSNSVNFASDSVTSIDNAILEFKNAESLSPSVMQTVRRSIELTNESPILGDITVTNSDELKRRIQNSFSSQSRAVTLEDYKSLCYSMPTKYGAIKRVNVVRDDNSLKRNLNLFVLCEDADGFLTQPNESVKNNLKTWISKNKMINDSIDILNGKIVNYGIEFTAVGSNDRQKMDILTDAVTQLTKDFSQVYDFGQQLTITDVYSSLKKVKGLIDVVAVKIVPKIGDVYSDASFNFEKNASSDGRFIKVPLNVVMELKYPKSDIKGTII